MIVDDIVLKSSMLPSFILLYKYPRATSSVAQVRRLLKWGWAHRKCEETAGIGARTLLHETCVAFFLLGPTRVSDSGQCSG